MLYMDINKAFDELKDTVNKKINLYEERNKELQKENEALKSEHYKDDEIQRLKKENDKLKEEINNGFPIYKDEWAKLEKWQIEHIKTAHNGVGKCGAIGGRFSYEFIPTGIGTFGSCRCICGEKFDFQEP